MRHRVDVKGRKVAASDVFGVIFGVIAADAASDVIVPRHTLAQVHHDRPCRIASANALVFHCRKTRARPASWQQCWQRCASR
jgi:hypothetical protein